MLQMKSKVALDVCFEFILRLFFSKVEQRQYKQLNMAYTWFLLLDLTHRVDEFST